MNARIAELYDAIARATTEIDNIRAGCSHPAFTVELYSWRVGAFSPQRICSECGSVIAGVTHDESNECWERNKMPWKELEGGKTVCTCSVPYKEVEDAIQRGNSSGSGNISYNINGNLHRK